MYQAFFDLTCALCERFTGLTPFQIRRERYHEVLLLYGRLLDKISREKKDTEEDKSFVITKKNGEKIIMRPAKDDAHW